MPDGDVAFSSSEARAIAERLGGTVVVKAQIHAGGRGKGGGVKVVANAQEAEQVAESMIGMSLVTAQTSSDGQVVSRVLVEQGLDIDRELYVGLLIDRSLGCPIVMASSAGGMDIEQVAADTPELILREAIDPGLVLTAFKARRLAFGLGLSGKSVKQAVQVVQAAYSVFKKYDASLVEINPLVVTKTGEVLALDGKVTLDASA